MRYLTLSEVLELYRQTMQRTGGMTGIHNLNALESALAQPRTTFAGKDLYPTLVDKASALGFSLIQNHPFMDGNKRLGHAAMETFLILNGFEIDASVDEQEQIILRVASGKMEREKLAEWLHTHVVPRSV